jgi:hypothetical protein
MLVVLRVKEIPADSSVGIFVLRFFTAENRESRVFAEMLCENSY